VIIFEETMIITHRVSMTMSVTLIATRLATILLLNSTTVV